MSFKSTAGIHWQALRTWIRGAKYHARPDSPAPRRDDLRSTPRTAKMCPVHNMPSESSETTRQRAA